MIKINTLTLQETLDYTRNLLENPVFNAVFYEFRNDAVTRWASTTPEQTAQRESAWSEYKAADALLQNFKNLVVEINSAIEQEREANDG